MTFPYHLVALLYYYVFVSSNFNTVKLLSFLIPTQVAYLVLQFNKCTVYGNKIIKINYSLTIICLGVTFLLSFPTMLLTILFGAPLMDLLWETWLLSLHFAFLAYPAVYSVFNCDFKVGLWKKYFIFIVVGGWISCVVIPLVGIEIGRIGQFLLLLEVIWALWWAILSVPIYNIGNLKICI